MGEGVYAEILLSLADWKNSHKTVFPAFTYTSLFWMSVLLGMDYQGLNKIFCVVLKS